MEKGIVFDIKNFSIHDGPGIRTTVFLKGCPIKCLWCSNPESQKAEPEIMMFPERCVNCGECTEVCPTGAAKNGYTDNEKCTGCGKCLEVCKSQARKLIGKTTTSEEVVKEVMKDKIVYDNSGGGVTLGGGETCMQPKFAAEIFKKCKEQGVHTILDTSGYCNENEFLEIVKYVDLVYFDIKCILPEKHRELTGFDNGKILNNLKNLDRLGIPFTIRMPIIPGYNDSEEIINTTGEFLKTLKSEFSVYLLAYHGYGAAKYSRINKEYQLKNLKNMPKEDLEPIKEKLEAYGLNVRIQ